VWANDKICMTPAEAQRRLDNKNIETVQPPHCTKRSGGKLRLFIGFCMRACFCVGIRTFRSCQAVGDRAFCVAGPCVELYVIIDTECTFVACIQAAAEM